MKAILLKVLCALILSLTFTCAENQAQTVPSLPGAALEHGNFGGNSSNLPPIAPPPSTASSCQEGYPGLDLWLKADSLNLNNNQFLSSWTTSVPNRTETFFPSHPPYRPRYIANGLNGWPVVEFDNVNDGLLSTYSTGSDYTVVALYASAAPQTWCAAVQGMGNSLAIGCIYGMHGAYAYNGTTFTYFNVNAAPPVASGQYVVSGVTSDSFSNSMGHYINGILLGTAPMVSPITNLALGSGQGVWGYSWTPLGGYIAEVLVYDRALNSDEMLGLFKCLSSIYYLQTQ